MHVWHKDYFSLKSDTVSDRLVEPVGFTADYEHIHAFELEKMFDKQMRTLSGGTTQKVSAVLAFLFNPEVLILDEPTAGLDPLASEILKEKIIREKEKGKLPVGNFIRTAIIGKRVFI